MAKSTNIIGDIGTVITNGPTAATKVLFNAAAGPLVDYIGTCKQIKQTAQHAAVIVALMQGVTDAGDSANTTALAALLAVLNGTSTPSTQTLADSNLLAPGTTTKANCNAAAGPIMDYVGMGKLLHLRFQELLVSVTILLSVTDASDTSKTQLQQISDVSV